MIYSNRAIVRLKPTYTTPLSQDVDEIVVSAPAERQLQSDLLAVRVANSITAPYQTFRIDLAPHSAWANLIRPYSLVSIALQRYAPGDMAATSTPEPVLLGLVDYVDVTEDYGQASPHRRISVCGRSLSATLSDNRWWHHWFLADADGKRRDPPEWSNLFAGHLGEAQLKQEAQLAARGFFAVDPHLFDALVDSHPARAMKLAFDFYVGTADQTGFIKLEFGSDGKRERLASRLLFDEAATQAGFHDPSCRLVKQAMPTSLLQDASCWDALAHFCEQPFTELFTDTYGNTVNDAAVHVIARKPPWAGFIGFEGNKAVVDFKTGRPKGGQSLFDSEHGRWDAFIDTVNINVGARNDVVCINLRRGVDGRNATFNAFSVLPETSSPAGNNTGDQLLQREIPPLIDEDPDSTSYVLRYGLRPAPRHQSKYISVVGVDESKLEMGDAKSRAMAYELLLREWYHRQPEFWHGSYVLKGRTELRVGKRLLDHRAKREFYITSVVHDLRCDTGRFISTVNVERGWDLE